MEPPLGLRENSHSSHSHAIEHGLHEDLILIASVVAKRVNHPFDRLSNGCAAGYTQLRNRTSLPGNSPLPSSPAHCSAR